MSDNDKLTEHSWHDALRVYSQPRVIGMLFLGFSAGLPLLLIFSTLSAWLREADVSRTTIGFFSWIGITYSIKVLWAPIVDSMPLPLLTRLLGQRRSWLLLAQMGIALGLLLLSFTSPEHELSLFALFAFLVAISSATQDIVIDAYRIEAVHREYQGAMAATYVLGYRLATLASGAGALYMADFFDWSSSYQLMALLTAIGIITTLVIREPEHRIRPGTLARQEQLVSQVSEQVSRTGLIRCISEWFAAAVVSPFAEFFQRTGSRALLILLLIATYRITDITMAVMANPFYLDLGFSLTEIANITKIFGFVLTIVGAGLGGILVVRFGIMRPLILGSIAVICSNLLFGWLSTVGPNINLLALVISADSLAGGLATAAFIAYLSSLTNTAYTATQYALFSSLMTFFPKLIAGFSGIVVDHYGYLTFYVYASLLGLPALLVSLYLWRRHIDTSA